MEFEQLHIEPLRKLTYFLMYINYLYIEKLCLFYERLLFEGSSSFFTCRNSSEILSTLRFGQRIKSVRNEPVINEISEDDVNGLSDQIRQLKVENF